MKRICFLTDSIFSVGGVQRVTAVIAKELAKDYDVTILTKDKSSQEDTSLYGLNEANIHYRYFEFPKTRSWKYYFCKAYSYLYRRYLPQTPFTSAIYAHSSFPAEKRKVLLREFKKGQYDVIIGVHASLSVKLASCKKSLKGTRLIGWIHNSYEALFSEGSLYVGSDLRKHYEWQLAKLDATIVLSNDDAQRYHIATKVIYNPLTLKPDSPSTGTSNKFLAVGRFSRQHKGFDLLIEAFHLFAETNDDWTLDIVGEGPEEPLYRQLIEDYGLQKRITSPTISRGTTTKRRSMCWAHAGKVLAGYWSRRWPTDCPLSRRTSRQAMRSWATSVSTSSMAMSRAWHIRCRQPPNWTGL